MIKGNLDRLHFGDLLQWFQMGGVSGRLILNDPRGERRLDFIDGRVCYASSTIPEERLATWLTKRSLIPLSELRRILATSMVRRALFTDLLIGEGRVSPEDLQASLTDLAEAITSRILISPEVSFEFIPNHPVLDILGLSLNVEPSQLLMEAARRSDEGSQGEAERRSYELAFTGEAFEDLFWQMIRDGVSEEDAIDGSQLSRLHDLVRDIVTTLAQWLSSSPGLVPLPAGQIEGLLANAKDELPFYLPGRPHAAWNQMVLACTVRNHGHPGPLTLAELETIATDLNLWEEMIGSGFLKRPEAAKLDELIQHVVAAWSQTAAAAAPHLDVAPETASLAVHLVTVPTDLVLWALTSLPVPHQRLRKTLLEHLSRRVGSRLAHLADFPSEIRRVLDPRSPTPLGVCLHLGRECLSTAATWPTTIPGGAETMLEIASPAALALAADAAREVAETFDEDAFSS
jgi:hypothetical protein